MTPTATPPVGSGLLTAEVYADLPDDGRFTELVKGRVVDVSRPSSRHGLIMLRVGRLVGNFVEDHDLGHVTAGDSGIVTERGPDTVRGADVAFYSYDRLPKGAMPEKGYAAAAPDIVFEVRSPSDRMRDIMVKAAEYFDAGVRAVCLVEPRSESVTVYRPDGELPQTIHNGDDFEVPDILPGFRVAVKRFFA